MSTLFGAFPCTMKPAIITRSLVPTCSRVEMFPSVAGLGVGVGVATGVGVGVGVSVGVAIGLGVGVGVDVGVGLGVRVGVAVGVGLGVGVPVGPVRKAFRTDSVMLSEPLR